MSGDENGGWQLGIYRRADGRTGDGQKAITMNYVFSDTRFQRRRRRRQRPNSSSVLIPGGRKRRRGKRRQKKSSLPPLIGRAHASVEKRRNKVFPTGGGRETTSHFLTDDASFREKKPCCSPNFPPSPLPHGLGVARRVNYVAKNPLTQKFLLKTRSK